MDVPVEMPFPLSGSGSKIGSKIPNSLTFPNDKGLQSNKSQVEIMK